MANKRSRKNKDKSRNPPRRDFAHQSGSSPYGFNPAPAPESNNGASYPSHNHQRSTDSTTGSEHSHNNSSSNLNLSAFIDHRMHDNLANIHSSPARSRRRSTQQQFQQSPNNSNSSYSHQYGSHNPDPRTPSSSSGPILRSSINTSSNPGLNTGRRPKSSRGGPTSITNDNVGNNQIRNAVYDRRASLPLTNKNLQSLLSQSGTKSGEVNNGGKRATRATKATNPGAGQSVHNLNENPSERTSYGSVMLDMDEFAQEQQRLAAAQNWKDAFANGYNNRRRSNSEDSGQFMDSEDDDNLSINSLEFGGSNPSSEHSSDSTSLDDVCFPDYYDHDIDFEGNKESNYRWPDLQVLQEFVDSELKEYGDACHEAEERHNDGDSAQNVNFHFPVAHSVSGKSPDDDEQLSPHQQDNEDSSFFHHASSPQEYPEEGSTRNSRETTPLLNNKQVNELASLDSMDNSIRIRPQPIQPWEKSKEHIQTILNTNPTSPSQFSGSKFPSRPQLPQTQQHSHLYDKNSRFGKGDSSLCRFTYFREDLEKTIHSPTISGLLAKGSSNKVQDGATSIARKWGRSFNDDEDGKRQEALEGENLSLQDLFMPSYYAQKYHSSASSLSMKAGSPEVNEGEANTGIDDFVTSGVVDPTAVISSPTQPQRAANIGMSNAAPNSSATELGGKANVAGSASNLVNHQTSASHLHRQGLTFDASTSATAPGTSAASLAATNREFTANPFWLDVLDPTEEEMKVISKTFGVHPLTTEDIFLGEAREKVELFKSYYFICFTSFDIVYERRKQRAKEQEKKNSKLQEMYDKIESNGGSRGSSIYGGNDRKSKIWSYITKVFGRRDRDNRSSYSFQQDYHNNTNNNNTRSNASGRSKSKKIREGELCPLNMYMIVFRDAVITFHFSATPHPINVRRRARLLRDYLNVSSDWICYALIDDITDSFAPMIESIEEEVNLIEDAILKMHSGDTDSEDEDSDSDDDGFSDDEDGYDTRHHQKTRHGSHHSPHPDNIFYKRKRSKSTVDGNNAFPQRLSKNNRMSRSGGITSSATSQRSKKSSKSSSSKSTSSKILGWKRKGDMLRRIGECRKRVMSVLRLLGSKADVIKGFSKRFSEQMEANNYAANGLGGNIVASRSGTGLSPKSDIGMYLGDIQDHIVTMVQSLNHYEKLLARFHSNYLAQINIDMTKVNNDTNDVLGKITILGTIVLPINVVTGLWGMNCIVPGQDYEGLAWFWGIVCGMVLFSVFAYNYAKRAYGL